jgi:IS30 family transposase
MTKRRVDRAKFWQEVSAGSSNERAAVAAGIGVVTGRTWVREAGGVIPQHLLREPSGRYLTVMDRAVIEVGLKQKLSMRAIAVMIGRAPTTITREVARHRLLNGFSPLGKQTYKAYNADRAQLQAEKELVRPQASKLALAPALHAEVQKGLTMKWSPEQISNRLKEDFPDQTGMRVSAETIYRSLYVQGRGSLKREITVALRTGRTLRKPQRQNAAATAARNNTRIADKIMIADRPPQIEDRAVPGHWEGDLIIGEDGGSQIGTLVERSTRTVLLLHLPDSRDASVVADAMIAAIKKLPTQMMKSVTWDQGIELALHKKITIATDVAIYFCDPHSPWQRGSNENTNGLLRQYFPKGTDLSVHSQEHLDFVAAEVNGRPRKSLGWATPAEAFHRLVLGQNQPGVASTT